MPERLPPCCEAACPYGGVLEVREPSGANVYVCAIHCGFVAAERLTHGTEWVRVVLAEH